MEAGDITPVTDRFRAMGSDVVAMLNGPSELSGTAEAILSRLEAVWSRFVEESDVSRLNRSNDWVSVSSDTIILFQRALSAWEITAGVFDPTILPSLVAAGYGESRSERPGRSILDAPTVRGASPGMAQIDIDPACGRIRLGDSIAFDPGGIGKGLAADIVATRLIEAGARSCMVAVGGDVRVAGNTPRDWTVEVESPFNPNDTIATLRILDGAVCTSSVRAKSWENDGEAMHHIINPFTGAPSGSSIVSATVVAGEAWMAEALCKAVIMTEPLDAIAYCQSHGVEAIIVDIEGIIWTTDGTARFAA